LTLYVVWGSTYLANTELVAELPGLLAAGLRCALAGAILVAIGAIRGRSWPDARAWMAAAKAGLPLAHFGTAFVAVAQQTVSSGLAALVLASIPAWLVLWSWVMEGTAPRAVDLAGCALGAAGVGVLVGAEWSAGPAVALLVLASCSWAFGSVLLRSPALPRDPSLALGMAILVGGLAAIGGGLAVGERFAPLSSQGMGALAFLVLAGSVLGGSVFAWLVRSASAPVAGSYALVNPVVAIALGAWLHDEAITGEMVAGGGAILAGLGLMTRPRRLAGRTPPERAVEPQMERRAS
jgi:drug/metabolite transporter (DMT)-like permease